MAPGIPGAEPITATTTRSPALFERVKTDQGKLDILVNNVYKIPSPPAWGGGFWDHPVSIWDDQVGIGLRSHYACVMARS